MPFKSQAQRRKFAQLLVDGKYRTRPLRNGIAKRDARSCLRGHEAEAEAVSKAEVAPSFCVKEAVTGGAGRCASCRPRQLRAGRQWTPHADWPRREH